MGVLKRVHFDPYLNPRMLHELRSWAEEEAAQLGAAADRLNLRLPAEHRHLVEAVGEAAERLRHLVEDL